MKETEGATEQKAHEVVEQIWTIIENAANYMFCAAHAFSMACDSLYAAWLKVHYPYELYLTMLKLYDEKKNTDKISAIIAEMKKYKGISLTAGKFGQDNRDWLVDKDNNSISQSLSSIRYMSKQSAKDLYALGRKMYPSFADALRALQMDSCLDTRQIKILIELGYFSHFGGSAKLMKVYSEFFDGKDKVTKTIKSYEERLEKLRRLEVSLAEEDLPIGMRLKSEHDNIGLCLSADKNQPADLYFVTDIDTKYGVKAKFYSVQRGASGTVRIRKDIFEKNPFEVGDCVKLTEFSKMPKYRYKGGAKVEIPNEYDIWARKYSVLPGNNKE